AQGGAASRGLPGRGPCAPTRGTAPPPREIRRRDASFHAALSGGVHGNKAPVPDWFPDRAVPRSGRRRRNFDQKRSTIGRAGMILHGGMAVRAVRFVVMAAASLAILTAPADAQGRGKGGKRAADTQTVEQKKKA